MTTTSQPTENDVSERAARLISDSEEGKVSPDAVKWLKESPLHVEETLMMTALLHRMQDLSPATQVAIDATLELEPHREGQSASYTPARRSFIRTRPAAFLSVAIAATIIAVAVGFYFMNAAGQWQHYATQLGQRKTINLEDGSVVKLNTNTEIVVRISSEVREIRVLTGEAAFKVVHEQARPFLVRAGNTLVRSIGTEFDVNHDVAKGETSVVVAAGVVEVTAEPAAAPAKEPNVAKVVAGQGVLVSADAQIDALAENRRANALAWQEGRLIFRRALLGDVARELNRYNNLQLQVEGKAADHLTSGVFDIDSPESLVKVLKVDSSLEIKERNGKIIIREHSR